MKSSLCLVAMLCSSVTFAANGDSYFGGGFHIGKYEENEFPSASPRALKLEFGKYITDAVALEGHFALGLGGDTLSTQALDIDLELEQAISLFVKGDINLNENVNFYGLFGVSRGKFKATIPEFDVSFSDDDSGFSYGFGIEAKNTNGVVFSAEYIMYLSEDEYDYSGFNIGIAKSY